MRARELRAVTIDLPDDLVASIRKYVATKDLPQLAALNAVAHIGERVAGIVGRLDAQGCCARCKSKIDDCYCVGGPR